MNKRVIARLDIKGPNLVKGIHLEGLRVLGQPEDFAKFYYNQGIDELIYQDVVASLYDRNSLNNIITKTATNIFIPLTVGGGLRTIEDIKNVLRAGADKVSINSGAIRNPDFIRQASEEFGASTIVIAIEAIRHPDGKYYAYIDNGREATGRQIVEWAAEAQSLGAGEILLTSVDRDGTGEGFDSKLIESVTKVVTIPVIAHGGAGKAEDVSDALKSGATAIAAASVLHYDAVLKGSVSNQSVSKEGNRAFLNSGSVFKRISSCSVMDLKSEVKKAGFNCRE